MVKVKYREGGCDKAACIKHTKLVNPEKKSEIHEYKENIHNPWKPIFVVAIDAKGSEFQIFLQNSQVHFIIASEN